MIYPCPYTNIYYGKLLAHTPGKQPYTDKSTIVPWFIRMIMASADRLSACVLTTPLAHWSIWHWVVSVRTLWQSQCHTLIDWRLCPHHSLCAFYTHTQHCLFTAAVLVSEQSHLYFCYYYYNHNDFHNYCNTTNWKQSVKHWQKYLVSTFAGFFS